MYTKLKNILRCYASGMGIKETALTFHISRNTVRKYVRMFITSGKSAEQLLSLSEEHLRELFGIKEFRNREASQQRMELDALIPEYAARLSKKGMTVRKLFNEYRDSHPDGLQETTFKLAIRQYRVHSKVVGHVEHYAADQMYIDFAGDKLEIVDEMTGEVKKCEVFVAILPFSHYTYCEAVWSQKKEDLIKACQNAFEYFEGVTAAIVPDNLKAAVSRSDRNEPIINEEFAAFAEHYGCAVYPARVRHPKDKALVENAVKLLYRSVYLDIEGMVFRSLDELNTAVHISLLDFNEKLMAGRDISRKDMFIKGEKDFLRQLPERRFVIKERKLMTVGKNCYVSLFKHHYSVPREHVGKRVVLLYDADTVDIYCGLNRVATHDRCDIPYTYSWKKEHNLPGHYGPYDKDLQELFDKAAQMDNIVYNYLLEVDRTMQYPPKSFSSCRGIMSLEKKYGPDRLVAACACATQKSEYSYQAVRQVLEQGDDADFLPDEDGNILTDDGHAKAPVHKNIRGREYYGQTNNINEIKKKTTMEINEKTAPVSQQPDQNTISLDLMNRMKMHGMAEAFRESLAGTIAQSMTPDSFLHMLLSHEWDYRSQAAVARMTKNAAFRYKAYLEEIDYNVSRGLDRNQMERLSTLDFAKSGKNLFITGPSGTGKSFLACALGHEACKKGIRTLYANASKLLGQLKVAKVKNILEAEMKKIERAQLLILDDLFLVPLDPKERAILLEIVEDRHERKSIIITSQYPHTSWYDMVGDQTVADAILDRIIHSAHTIELTGESMRKLKAKKG